VPDRQNLRGILFDIDGVLYCADKLIDGAPEAAAWVREEGIPHLFVTNTTSKPRVALAEKLCSLGVPAQESDILTPAAAAATWLRDQPQTIVALFVRPAARVDFAGLQCVADDAEHGASHIVVGDLGDLWDYRTLNRAFRLLYQNPNAELIALGMSRYWLAADGIALDVAPFVVALEHATGRKALVFGKPAKAFFEAAAERLGLAPKELLMIGDDIQADIGGAQAAGLKAALVKTGKFRPADLAGSIKPELLLDSIADLPRWWSRQASDKVSE
jgi:HAD superfamily hydrolase (TIGR01458 family)